MDLKELKTLTRTCVDTMQSGSWNRKWKLCEWEPQVTCHQTVN